MDVTSLPETLKVEDLRQSPNWATYLEWLGWRSVRTLGGANVEVMPTKIGGLVKVQRPHELKEEELAEIELIALEAKAPFVKVEPMTWQDMAVFEKLGFKPSISPLSPPSTIYMNLSLNEPELWKSISKSGRYSIRHSQAETVFHKNPSKELLAQFYAIAKETARVQKFALQSFEDLQKKVEVFGDESFLALGFDSDKNITGGKFFVSYKDAVWYLHAGTNNLGRSSDSGHKMMWDALLYFKNLGYRVMDMDGIDDPRFSSFTKNWGGFSYFKEKFGGTVVRFPYSQVKVFNPFFKFLGKLRPLPF
jgi:lipid II:glycine glycyltransferase (peptidoglycan interpeptide bridge formation enzyme)